MRTVYIYALKSPVNGLVMYVGKTNDPEIRHKQHVFEAWRYAPTSAKLKWISELLENDLEPEIEVIDTCDESNCIGIEAKWIAYYAKMNPLLTNRENIQLADSSRPESDKMVKMMVRLPPSLHKQITDLAKKEQRSLNAQIIILLEQAQQCRNQPTHRSPTP